MAALKAQREESTKLQKSLENAAKKERAALEKQMQLEIDKLVKEAAANKQQLEPAESFPQSWSAAPDDSTPSTPLRLQRKNKRVLIVDPGFGLKANPQQANAIYKAGYARVELCRVTNPEVISGQEVEQQTSILQQRIRDFKPDVIACASKGGRYAIDLWKRGVKVPTLMINAHPACTILPKDTNIIITHGSNDDIWPRSRRSLQALVRTGSEGSCHLYWGDGDGHNMASLLQNDTILSFIDDLATNNLKTAFNGPGVRSGPGSTVRDYKWWNIAHFVVVPRTSSEFVELKTSFCSSVPFAQVSKIERVQHRLLWSFYSRRRSVLQMKNGGNANELLLWHGTRSISPKDLLATSESGLDMRFSSLNGFYGSGIYFACKSRYPHYGDYVYKDPQTSVRAIIACKVAVGSAHEAGTNIYRETRLPPHVRGAAASGVRYDSIKGGPHRPSTAGPGNNDSEMYVVYNNEQVYPAYIVYYTA